MRWSKSDGSRSSPGKARISSAPAAKVEKMKR